MIQSTKVRNMIVECRKVGKNEVALIVTGPASQRNRGAHAVDRVAREVLAKALGFSPAKLRQAVKFSPDCKVYALSVRYATCL